MTFSQKLKTAMENLNLRQVDVANLTGKGKNAISQYIAGKNIPPEKTRKEMAAALGLNENYFETDIPIVKVLKNDYVIILLFFVAICYMVGSGFSPFLYFRF